jgi:uncharacterized protein
MSGRDPTFLGSVTAVSGATVTVALARSLSSGLAIIGGQTYRVGQVGSFVRIPQGYHDLYGVVCEIGATLVPEGAATSETGRWLRVELAGETIGGRFERGLSQHPNIQDAVHTVTEDDLQKIYGGFADDQISIGCLSSAENVVVKIALNSLVTRHSAVLGSTGSGKSTTVSSLLRSIVTTSNGNTGVSGARILLLDVHGEYSSALSDIGKVLSITPQQAENGLFVPFWAMNSDDLLEFLVGPLSENHRMAFTDKILQQKLSTAASVKYPGLETGSITADTPVPFSLQQLWYDLVDFETTTYAGPQRDQPQRISTGDASNLIAPTYTPHAMGTAGPFLNQAARGIRRHLDLLRSKLLDRRFDFILHPGDWEPDLKGATKKDLDSLLEAWIGHDRPITIVDLSGVPSASLVRMVGSILRLTYEALFWSREKTEGGVLRPLLVVMEEAHRYLKPDANNVASEIVQRIAKEGRKYGVGAMVVSQRPAEVDETILSQCGTFIALRLSNPSDRARVRGALPDNLAGLMDLLPVLRTGEAIIAGEAARLPVRCRITMPKEEHRPHSSDPDVTSAWASRRKSEGYDRVVAAWRAQRTTAVAKPLVIIRKSVPDEEA